MLKREYIEVHWTCGNLEEARKIARLLVESRLVACAQIIPWIESIYLWNDQLETSQESKVLCKTHQRFYAQIQELILHHASYEIPEITATPLTEISPSYEEWLLGNLERHESSNLPS